MSADVETPLAQPNTMPDSNMSRVSCKVYGCKRTYTDMEALNSHLSDHQIAVESLPGKVFLCSIVGCEGSFSSMQELMEHMRVHYKPNIFFICESCRAKLRSYRTLLKHLQTCAKVAKSKAVRPEAPSEQATELEPPALTAAPDASETSEPEQMETEPSEPVAAATTPTASGHSPDPPSLAFSPGEAPAQSPGMPQSPPSQPLSSPSPQSAAAASSAAWRKNQGQSFSSRILWEHTRGRYNCLQCGHSTPNRKEMTAHIDGQHKSPSGRTPSEPDGTESSPTQLQPPSDCEPSADTQP